MPPYIPRAAVRDFFQPELWLQLHSEPATPLSFLSTELPATLGLLLFLPLLARIRSNRAAMLLLFGVLALASASLPLLSRLRRSGAISVRDARCFTRAPRRAAAACVCLSRCACKSHHPTIVPRSARTGRVPPGLVRSARPST